MPVRELLELRGQHSKLGDVLVTDVLRAARAPRSESPIPIAASGHLPPNDFALADELRRKLRRAAVLAAGSAQNERIPTVFNDCLRVPCAVDTGDLRNRLEPKHTTTTKFPQPRKRVLEPVDCPERIEFIDH